MRLGQRGQGSGDRIPELAARRRDHVSTDLEAERVVKREALRQVAVERDEGRDGGVVEDTNVLYQTGSDEVGVRRGQHRRRARNVGVHHDLEPQTKASRIEPLVLAR